MKEKTSNQYHGILVLNKPKGPTSNFCVEKIKKRFKQKKVGHAGIWPYPQIYHRPKRSYKFDHQDQLYL